MKDVADRLALTPAYSDASALVYACEHSVLAAAMREAGVRADAMIVDAPYSERTHAGHDDGTASANRVADWAARAAAAGREYANLHCTPRGQVAFAVSKGAARRSIEYNAWSADDVRAFVDAWSPFVGGWLVSLTDHVLASSWAGAYETNGRYSFAPLACVETAGRIRLLGDGPPQWACFAVVGRPSSRPWIEAWQEDRRSRGEPCSLKGAHVGGRDPDAGSRWVGGKPVWLIRALVRDYSRPGDLVVDPCCGAGTLGVACRYEGRRALMCDRDPAAVETTIKRLRGERTKPTRDDYPETKEQPSLFGPGKR